MTLSYTCASLKLPCEPGGKRAEHLWQQAPWTALNFGSRWIRLIFNFIEMNNLHGSSFLSWFQYKRAVISDVKIPLFLEEMVSGYGYLRDTGYVLSVLFILNAQSASPEKLLRTSAEGECSAGLLWASPGMELESELRPKGEGCLQDWGCILCLSHDTCVLVYILTVKSIL